MNKKQKIRLKFKNDVFNRDNNQCVFCNNVAVDAHHITDRNEIPNGGYVLENGISVCDKHHIKCEEYHISRTWEKGYHPIDLYNLIKSSYKNAYLQSKLL